MKYFTVVNEENIANKFRFCQEAVDQQDVVLYMKVYEVDTVSSPTTPVGAGLLHFTP